MKTADVIVITSEAILVQIEKKMLAFLAFTLYL